MRITANKIACSSYNIFGAELSFSFSISFDVVIATASYVVELPFFLDMILLTRDVNFVSPTHQNGYGKEKAELNLFYKSNIFKIAHVCTHI